MGSLRTTGVGHCGSDWSLSSISGLVMWNDPSIPGGLWEDTAGTTQATISETLARIDDRTANACRFEQGTAANEPTLVAWDATKLGIFMADSTDILSGVTAVLAASNGVAGWTEAFVVELPPVLGATFSFTRMTCNAGNVKFHTFMDANNKFFLQTRRVTTDAVDTSACDATVVAVGGTRYVIIASVDYLSGASVMSVNGATTGQGDTGTAAWGKAATCEALNAGLHSIGGTSPPTLATFGEHLCWNRALTAAERTLVNSYLTNKWGI